MSTIQDVAKQAGFSIATVSRALNNPDKVSSETRERVLEAVRKLDYYPDEKAKLLGSKNKDKDILIGVVVPYITSFFFGELYKGLSRMAQSQNVRLLLHELNIEGGGQQSLMDALVFCKQHGASGVIVSSHYIPEDYDVAISRLKIPVVLVLANHEHAKLPAYKIDDRKASFDAVGYLVTRGHKRIGMISGTVADKVVGEPRFSGYKQGLEFYGLPFDDRLVAYGGIRYEEGYSCMKQLLEDREETGLTAVFAATDELAIGAMRCIRDAGLSVPEDISVIGFDNLSVSNMVTPRLTTVSQPFADIGAEGVKFLVDAIKDPNQNMEQGTFYLPYKIIERESVAEITNGQSE